MSQLALTLRSPHGTPWLAFRDPRRILVADDPADVRACLRDVDRAVRGERCWAAGFVCYEAAAAFGLPVAARSPQDLPLVLFGVFEPGHVTPTDAGPAGGACAIGRWEPSVSRVAYDAAIAAIRSRIAAGDTYQINFTFRLRAPLRGDPSGVLTMLDAGQRGAWGGFVDLGTHAICSASPELFFRTVGTHIECRPMKGTAPREPGAAADRAAADALRRSAKNRAENVMVVDMTRNDVGRIARVGSVTAPALFEIERYPRQWQMTSTVTADIGTTALEDLFAALFPSGSVTGAPKHSSMAIIRDLERAPRGVYTGAIGCLSPDGQSHFNVAIRTVVVDRRTGIAEFGVGSGVVWDSVDRAEYDECVNKASILAPGPSAFSLLESLRWDPDGGYALLERHLDRLRESADYFDIPAPHGPVLRDALDAEVVGRTSAAKVRLLVGADGQVRTESADLGVTRALWRVAFALEPVSSRDVFLYHKTTNRQAYERARASRPDADAVLLWNERGEVTESPDANLVVELDGRRWTPPVDAGLLAGTFRAHLLASGDVAERRLSRGDVSRAPRLWLVNSVRGWMDAVLVE